MEQGISSVAWQFCWSWLVVGGPYNDQNWRLIFGIDRLSREGEMCGGDVYVIAYQ